MIRKPLRGAKSLRKRTTDEKMPMVVDQDFDGDGDVDRVVNLDTERLAEYEMDAYCEVWALTYDGDRKSVV